MIQTTFDCLSLASRNTKLSSSENFVDGRQDNAVLSEPGCIFRTTRSVGSFTKNPSKFPLKMLSKLTHR